MSTEDQNHLPIRTITTGDTFNDWRRITNSIAENSKAAVETGSHLYLGDYDWTGDVFRATVLPMGNPNAGESPIGATWDPANSVSYDSTHGGVRFTLANTSYGSNEEKYQQWARIRTRVPIDTSATYRIKVRIKNLRTSGANKIFLGAIGLNETFQALRTDVALTFNYGIAEGAILNNADVNGGITEYSALISGFNATDEGVDNKFDPGSKFFDIVYINHYTGTDMSEWEDADDDTIIQNIEIERLTSGIIITEHDSQDSNPQAELQIGYPSEDIIANPEIVNNVSLNLRQNLLVKGGSIITSTGGADNANVDMIYADDSNNTHGDSWHFQFDNAYKHNLQVDPNDPNGGLINYQVNSHRSTLRGGRIVMDTESNEISSLRSKLFIGKSVNYTTNTQSPTGLLNLAIGSANADETGAGPAINFYVPDSTAIDLENETDIELTDCQLSGQIACIKSEAPGTDAVPEAYGTGDMVFKVAKNASELKEILRLESDGQSTPNKVRKVTVGTTANNADLEIKGDLSRIGNLTYTWPTTRNSGGVDATNRVLSDNGAGVLSWKTVAAVSQNVTAFVQNETAPLGTIFAWASGSAVPTGFAECNGQAISGLTQLDGAQKTALQGVLGRANLPDLQQKVVVGRNVGVNNFEVFDTEGSADITGTTAGHPLTINEIPAHYHNTGFAVGGTNFSTGGVGVYGVTEDDVPGNAEGGDRGGGFGSNYQTITETVGGNENGNTASHSHSISLTNSNYQPYIALTYIMKVKADEIATLDITLGDDEFDEFVTTGGTSGEIGFDTTNLALSDGHPTWASNGHLYVRGVDLRLNTKHDLSKSNTDREQGRALVANSNSLDINYPDGEGGFDFTGVNLRGNKVIADDLSIAEIDTAGNQSLITKGYLDQAILQTDQKLALLVYNMTRVSPSGSYSSVERYSTSTITGADFFRTGALQGDGFLYTHSDANNRTLTPINYNRNKEYFAKVANGHPNLSLTIKIDFQFISNTDDSSDHTLYYRLKTTANPLDIDPGNGALVTVEERLNGALDVGTSGQPSTWGVARTVTDREITIAPGQIIFFKFVGRIDSGSGQQEGIGIRGFNIHSPTWS